MFSLCLHGFPLGASVSPTMKTCTSVLFRLLFRFVREGRGDVAAFIPPKGLQGYWGQIQFTRLAKARVHPDESPVSFMFKLTCQCS